MGTKTRKCGISPEATATAEFRLRVHLCVRALTHVHTWHWARSRGQTLPAALCPPMVLLKRLSSKGGGKSAGPTGPRAAVFPPC